ncbi:MAG TPA: DUF4342 domain-containing protein [Actinomycetota bacterium]|nr:DUF4342 domain-containing protein [Actinomycetota bacterium]
MEVGVMKENDTRWEEFKVAGDELVSEVRRLVKEGNVRRIVVKDEEHRTLVELPLTAGVVGALLIPVAAALGAIAALASGLTIEVEKVGEKKTA